MSTSAAASAVKDSAAKDVKVISLSELAKHTTRDDLWFAINGKIYDVTKFLDEHPGGEEVLIDCGGRDATQDFEDVGHSEYATEMLADLYVGDGDPTELKVSKKPVSAQNVGSESQSKDYLLYAFVAVLVATGAALFFRATQ